MNYRLCGSGLHLCSSPVRLRIDSLVLQTFVVTLYDFEFARVDISEDPLCFKHKKNAVSVLCGHELLAQIVNDYAE
jgi:hypothetical protein